MNAAIQGILSDISNYGGSILSDQGSIENNYLVLLEACQAFDIDRCEWGVSFDASEYVDESIDEMLMAINDLVMSVGIILLYHPDDPGTLIFIDAGNIEWFEG